VGPYAEVKSSDFNLRLEMLRELADPQFSEREFQTAGALTEKALADKANVTLGYISDLIETNLDSHNGTEFWSEGMAIYKLTHWPFPLDLWSVPASQAFVLLRILQECHSECTDRLLVYHGCCVLTLALARFSCFNNKINT